MIYNSGVTQILFNTENQVKFQNAVAVCSQYDIAVIQGNAGVDEIQSEDPKRVALDKAKRVFETLQKPAVITDDSWAIPALNGFPGVYIHSINHWLNAEDLLRLTEPLEDRRIILTQYLVYIDGNQTKVFHDQTIGTILKESRGTSKYHHLQITSMPGDGGMSIAEAYERGVDKSKRQSAQIWHTFAKWLITQNKG